MLILMWTRFIFFRAVKESFHDNQGSSPCWKRKRLLALQDAPVNGLLLCKIIHWHRWVVLLAKVFKANPFVYYCKNFREISLKPLIFTNLGLWASSRIVAIKYKILQFIEFPRSCCEVSAWAPHLRVLKCLFWHQRYKYSHTILAGRRILNTFMPSSKNFRI